MLDPSLLYNGQAEKLPDHSVGRIMQFAIFHLLAQGQVSFSTGAELDGGVGVGRVHPPQYYKPQLARQCLMNLIPQAL